MDAAGGERVVDRGQQPLRVDGVVQHVESRDHVEPFGQPVGGVEHRERDAVRDPRLGRQRAGPFDDGGVRVVADDGARRERLGERDRAASGAAADVGDAGARAQPVLYVGHQWQPLLDEQVAVPAGGEPLGADPDVLVQVLERDPAAGVEGVGDAVEALEPPTSSWCTPPKNVGPASCASVGTCAVGSTIRPSTGLRCR